MDTTVDTRAGTVRGREADGVVAFKGIPYAAPPFGERRLRPPQPAEDWDGIREATAFGPKSPQPDYPPAIAHITPPELTGSGEDCLTLNVWTPDPEADGLPVAVWIPGGMFEFHGTGASPWYDGRAFARDGVVCVTVTYRVGVDGFCSLDDGVANCGLLDQVAALEWVRENVAAFGGAPDRVTVFGESAGAASVATLLAMPRAEGLFERAITQSGAAQYVLSAESGARIARELADRLGVEPTRGAIAAVPTDRLIDAGIALRSDLEADPDPERWGREVVKTMLPWQPVVDGDVLPGHPLDRIASGASGEVDLLVGTNVDEHRLFLVPGGTIDRITEDALVGAIRGYGLPVDATLETYRGADPKATPGDLLAAVQTDWTWRIPALRLADAHADGAAATYSYEFAWRSPQYDGRLGACHALEIPFVFDTLGARTDALWGPDPTQSLADEMHAAWVRFVADGTADWPTYDRDRRTTRHFDTGSSVVTDPLGTVRRLAA